MKQAVCGGAIISFETGSYENALKLMENVKIPIVAVSLGGVESILSHPYNMSHASLSEEEKLEQGVTAGLLRLSVGIENVECLLKDLENALNKLR